MRILVKAYPQPSRTYEETVCVVSVNGDGREMLRLFPIRYRHLPKDPPARPLRLGRADDGAAALKPLEKPDYSLGYQFTSDGYKHRCTLLDWEVQAAWFNYQRIYGDNALNMMQQEYGEHIPRQNLHLIFGNQHKRPWQFIVIGVLRSTLDPIELDRQSRLFD